MSSKSDNYLIEKATEGLRKKGHGDDPVYRERLQEELDTIIECGLSDFMLNTAYAVLFLKNNDIAVGPGRGCLKHDTQVFTKNGFKDIKDLKVGEMVLSSDAKYHKVLSVQKYDNNERLLRIRPYYQNLNGIECTNDHKILIGGKREKRSHGGYNNIFYKKNKWVQADEVKENDFLVIPKYNLAKKEDVIDLADYSDDKMDITKDKIIEYSLGPQKQPIREINRFIPLNYDTGFFFGVFSGDGSFPKRNSAEIDICCNITDDSDNYIPKIINNLGFKRLNGNGSNKPYGKYINNESNCVYYWFSSRCLRNFLEDICPGYQRTAETKELFGYKLSENKDYLLGLIDGIVKSDGYNYKKGSKKTTISSISLKLLNQLRYVLLKMNVLSTVIPHNTQETRKKWKNSKQGYQLNFNRRFLEGDLKKIVARHDEYNFYLPVKRIEKINAENYVYDISVEDSYNFLTSNGIVHNSVGGSLVAYCIGISQVDPIKYNLSFARFLNKARMKTSICDIDVDISKNDRPRALSLLKKEFGYDKTCQIINDVYFSDKTIIQDLGRIFDIPVTVRNRLTALVGEGDALKVPEVLEFSDKHPHIRELFPKLKGLIRNSSTHAGGLLVSDKPMTDYISTLNVKDNIVTCYNGRTCEQLGFLKMDMLGLNTLSIIKDCLNFIGKKSFDFDYDLDDPRVYETINKSTLGIFQLEGKGASEYTNRLQPKKFNDIIAGLALVRPGGQDSGDADEFLEVRFNGKPIEYDHELLEPILSETNGCILYQEQAMEISRVLSGFTDVEADILRKGISKKLDYIFTEYKPKFIDGAVNNGVDEDIAEKIWNKIEKSSSYSFNKSHSVGYSLITYQTAYLKTYYPMEYYTAMLNNVESEEKRNRIYNEIKSLNKNLINPDINNSGQICMYTDDNIYLSFPLINGVGPAALEAILAHQPYKSFDDFMNRKTSKVNKGVVKALIEAGAFDRFGDRRDSLYSIIEEKDCHWDDKETLFREFQRIKINPKNNLLDLYDTKEMGLKCDISSVHELQDNTEEYKDFYVKLLPSEFNKKDNYAFVSATDGFNNMSLFVGNEFLSRYIDSLNTMGEPLLCHVHGKGEKYSLVSLIKLNEPDKYKHEYWSYIGTSIKKVQELQNANPSIHVGFISNVNYFTSKNGNPCARYDITLGTGETLEGRITVHPPLMYQGSFIFFEIGDNPVFPNIIQVA